MKILYTHCTVYTVHPIKYLKLMSGAHTIKKVLKVQIRSSVLILYSVRLPTLMVVLYCTVCTLSYYIYCLFFLFKPLFPLRLFSGAYWNNFTILIKSKINISFTVGHDGFIYITRPVQFLDLFTVNILLRRAGHKRQMWRHSDTVFWPKQLWAVALPLKIVLRLHFNSVDQTILVFSVSKE